MDDELTLKLGDKTFRLELNGGSLWDFEEAGHEDVVRKLVADLGDKADEQTVRIKLEELAVEAKMQLMNEVR